MSALNNWGWEPTSMQRFEQLVAEMEANGTTPANATVMSELMDEMLTAGQPWARKAFIGLLKGDYGSTARLRALTTVKDGFKEGGAIVSFVRMCVRHHHMELLSTVARMGLPEEMRVHTTPYDHLATTDHGLWLDLLANVGQDWHTSFLFQVRAFSTTETGAQLADILVEHDPNHRLIVTVEGEPAHRLVMAALMRRHIQVSSVASPTSSEPAARTERATSLRRRRTGL